MRGLLSHHKASIDQPSVCIFQGFPRPASMSFLWPRLFLFGLCCQKKRKMADPAKVDLPCGFNSQENWNMCSLWRRLPTSTRGIFLGFLDWQLHCKIYVAEQHIPIELTMWVLFPGHPQKPHNSPCGWPLQPGRPQNCDHWFISSDAVMLCYHSFILTGILPWSLRAVLFSLLKDAYRVMVGMLGSSLDFLH